MNILVVSSYLPYPLFSGGHVRLYNILKELSTRHTLTLVCEKRASQTDDDVEAVKKFCKTVITVPRNPQWSVGNIVKTAVSKSPFLVVGHTNREMKSALFELLQQEKYDCIHVETFYVLQNVPKTYIPIVLIEHNVEYLVYKRFADTAPLFLKPFLYLDVYKMKRLEQTYWRHVDKLVSVSEEEREVMGREDVSVVPNGVDLQKFKATSVLRKLTKESREAKRKRVLFIGNFKWIQNQHAAVWLIMHIWPEIKKLAKENVPFELELWIVGKHIPHSVKDLVDDKTITLDENTPDDTVQIFKKADVLVAPLQVGGGTSFKILEAMASGVPVVTTSQGIEGIAALDGEHVLIGESAEALAKLTLDALQNQGLRKQLMKNARELIEKKYDWKTIVEKLEKVYSSAVL